MGRIVLHSYTTPINSNSGMIATASQPRRNGPVVTTLRPMTLKDRVRRAFDNQPNYFLYASDMAQEFGASIESVKATIRDLRKDGYNIDYNTYYGAYHWNLPTYATAQSAARRAA